MGPHVSEPEGFLCPTVAARFIRKADGQHHFQREPQRDWLIRWATESLGSILGAFRKTGKCSCSERLTDVFFKEVKNPLLDYVDRGRGRCESMGNATETTTS